ncbi:MAG: secretin N-terminal domain-containing protein, partial [Planctomycetota bacterium]
SGEAENALPLVQFSVSTDLATNELVIHTSRQLADAVTQLARSFDTQSIRPGTSERLIAGVDDVVYVARKVQSPLNALRLQEQTQRLAARQLPGQTPTPAVAPKQNPANAVLIVAPATLMPVVLELANKLDQPGDPSSVFRVFALKQAAAAQVLDLLKDFYEPKGGLAARIKAVVDVRTNSLIVQGAPRDLDEVAALIQRIDHDESKAVSQMRIFPLRNARAEELVEVINTALRSALSDPLNQSGTQTGTGSAPPNGGSRGQRHGLGESCGSPGSSGRHPVGHSSHQS